MDIRELIRSDHQLLVDASRLFDREITGVRAEQFLSKEGHHVLVAYQNENQLGSSLASR